jgi:Ribosomal protein HS6-type (S12/L30/L7a)
MISSEGYSIQTESLPKVYGAMGLALRAGELITGSGLTEEAIRKGRALLVLIASDISDNTSKKLTNALKTYEVPYLILPATMEELAKALGKFNLVSSAAITNSGFVNIIKKLYNINSTENTTNGGATIHGKRS